MNPLDVFVALSCALLVVAGCKRAGSTEAPAASAAASAPSAAVSAITPAPSPGSARDAFRTPLPVRERHDDAPALRYAALGTAACKSELEARKLPVRAARGKTAGIETPLVLTGPLRGVRFEMPRTVYGFVDCRLVLVLDDLAGELALAGVTTVIVNNTYRPGSVVAKGARSAGQSSQHARGLAVDIMEFRRRDGSTLNVERDFHGTLGAPPCGPSARVAPEAPPSVELRNIVCTIARAGYCNHLITPNRDQAHFNHLHCDIEAGAHEIMVY